MGKRVKREKLMEFARPYLTRYYDQHDAKEDDHVAWGACSSEENAVTHSVGHVFGKRHAKAFIYDRRSGILIYTVRNDSMGIRVQFGRDVLERESMEKRLRLVQKAA